MTHITKDNMDEVYAASEAATKARQAAKPDAYQVVTDRIIEALERGVVPWRKPWRSVRGEMPTSLQTGREYRGINVWILSVESMLKGYQSPFWVTFKQAKDRGGSVRKGEKGTQVVLWKPFKKEVDGQDKKFLLLRYYTVFNLEQTDGVNVPEDVEVEADWHEPIESAEKIVREYVGPAIKHGGNRACYSVNLDTVMMPEAGQFTSPDRYYTTLFHELAHSTGHETRLKREELLSVKPFGSEDYSKEELVAEFAAGFLTATAGIEPDVEQSAAYINSWIRVLKNDRKLLVSAAAKAQKATDLILGVEPHKVEEAAA